MTSVSPGRLLRRTRRARWAILAIVAAIAADLAWTLIGVVLMGGLVVSEDWADWWDRGDSILLGIVGFLLFTAAFYVVRCQRELLRHLAAAGVDLLSPGVTFSTFAWLIPFANLFVPLRSFRQLAVAVEPGREQSIRRGLDLWWVFWIGGTFANRGATALHKLADTPGVWLWASALSLVGSAFLIGSGLLLARILPRLAELQAELRMLLDAFGDPAPRFATPQDLGLWWQRTVAPAPPAAAGTADGVDAGSAGLRSTP